MDTQTDQATAALSLGEQFRQAREALNLSIEQASAQVNLRPIILQSIENNELVHKNIPAMFMKGYVRNYGKFLKLPESLWNLDESFFGEKTKNDLNRNARARTITNPHASHSRWVGVLTVLVVLFAAGMTGYWWWENYQQSNSERDNLVQSYVAEEQKETPKSLNIAPTSASENNIASVSEVQSADNLTETKSAVDFSNNLNASLPAETTQQDQSVEQKNAETIAATENETKLASMTNAEANAPAQTAVENPQNSQTPALRGDLQIEITAATSWITVKDATRKNLVPQKEYKQGEVLSFDGQGPYSLTIGAPANVKITYKGELYPLTIDGRVARIKLQ